MSDLRPRCPSLSVFFFEVCSKEGGIHCLLRSLVAYRTVGRFGPDYRSTRSRLGPASFPVAVSSSPPAAGLHVGDIFHFAGGIYWDIEYGSSSSVPSSWKDSPRRRPDESKGVTQQPTKYYKGAGSLIIISPLFPVITVSWLTTPV